jgi:DNA-binding response OmpR family regulator
MIAMIVGDEDMRRGPIPIALAEAGFEARETFTTDEADCDVGTHGADACVLVVDAGSLDSRAGSATWTSFLTSHRAVAAVVVARGQVDSEARALASEPHRILLENPFDAATVVAAARRASSPCPPPIRRLPQRLRDAG